MRTHRSDFTTEELTQWLPKFQAELTEEFHTPDSARCTSVYQFRYDRYIITPNEDSVETYVVMNKGGKVRGLQDFLNDLWDDDPESIRQAIENDDYTGITIENGQATVTDEYDFAEWVKTNQKRVSVYGAMLRTSIQSGYLHLTRKAAERDLRENPQNHPDDAQVMPDYFQDSPDLQRLLELVYALDLEKSTLVFKEQDLMSHPLDLAAEASFNVGSPATNEHFVSDSDRLRLSNISTLAARTIYYFSRQAVLKDLALLCTYWLHERGVSDPWEAMREEYDRAKAKHGDMTLDSDKPTDEQRFYALTEEVGEVARALTYDQDHAGNLTNEITQLGALALAWLTHELGKGTTK